MSNSIPTRIAGLIVAAAIVAGACSSSDSRATESRGFDLGVSTTPTTSSPTSTNTQPRAETTSPAAPAAAVELAAVTIDEIGVASVAPRGWTEAPDGVFTGEEAVLAFGAALSWSSPSLIRIGFELVEQLDVHGNVWDVYATEADEVIVVVATTEIGNLTYLVQIAASPDVVDHYAESVATPALEAFEVDVAAISDGEIELATVIVDDRAVAYASGGSGATTVVFESGLGDGMATWEGVAPDVAEFAPIFVYDRPGYGRSDLTDTPRDGATMVAELRQLLVTTGHEPPYVLVGHSLGGTVMDLYARTHPDEVSGLVLVDSRHHEYTARCLAQLGEAGGCVVSDEVIESMPRPHGDELRGASLTEEQVAAAPGLDQQLHLVVIARGLSEQEDTSAAFELWRATQRDYAALVPGSRLVVAEESDHLIPQNQPAVIIDAIADLLAGAG